MDYREEAASQDDSNETTSNIRTSRVYSNEDEVDDNSEDEEKDEDEDEDDLNWTNTDDESDSNDDRQHSDEDAKLAFLEMYGDEDLDEW